MPALEGGAPIPVTTGGSGPVEARPAVPVYVVSGAGPVVGQRARRVVVVTSGPVEGGAAHPVYDAGAGAVSSAEPALPVYVVSGSLGAGASFAPSDLPNLALWLKADALALNDNDPVATWTDSSASATDATAAGGARPTYKTAVLNGRPAVLFNGTANVMTLAGAALNIARNMTGLTVIGVLRTATSTQRQAIFITTNDSSTARVTLRRSGSDVVLIAGRRLDADSFASAGAAVPVGAVWSIWTGALDYANATATLYQNGSQVAINATFQTAGATSNTASAAFKVGSGDGAEFWNDYIAEILIYQRVLSAAERSQVHAYLGTKYAITVSP